MTKTVVALIADTHINSTVALRHSDPFERDDGDVSLSSREQIWLWLNYCAFIAQFKRASRNARRVVIMAGDLIEGDKKKRSYQVHSHNAADAQKLAVRTLKPLARIAHEVYVVRGTAAHTGKSGTMEEQLAAVLPNVVKTNNGNYSGYTLRRDFGGVLFLVKHHGSGSARPWTSGGPAVRAAAETVIEYAGNGERVPQLGFYAHIHQCHDSFDNVPGCRVMSLPCWTFANEYVHRIGKGDTLPHIGGVIVACEDGEYEEPIKLRYKPTRGSDWARAERKGAKSIYRK